MATTPKCRACKDTYKILVRHPSKVGYTTADCKQCEGYKKPNDKNTKSTKPN